MDDFLTLDLDNDLLLDDEETSFEELEDIDSSEWEDQIGSLEKFDLDIDEEI
ncbi:hypothetical protein [Flammeovirga aprica]|uniref:Uncharacterized protein n=1 Tax=Flammeovirga aprica JL-4 TaxID=694437 RepID=A0A7X9XC28_9BACT|nr:hypothetical protein [Flammeovirga aprica]NME71308.1 hypothetical protein [Flammeovirga aprica JL-4]